MRRLAAALALLLVGGAGAAAVLSTTGDDEPRRLRPVRVAPPPAAEALAKAAQQAQLIGGEIGEILERARRTENLDLRLDELRRGDIVLRDLVVRKRGAQASAEADVDEREVAEYLPRGVDLRYDPRAGGDGVVFRGETSLLGVTVPVSVRVTADGGDVVALPEGLPVGRTTLFTDPRLRVDRVSARRAPRGLRVRVDGAFR